MKRIILSLLIAISILSTVNAQDLEGEILPSDRNHWWKSRG